jgi:hypothetical protein
MDEHTENQTSPAELLSMAEPAAEQAPDTQHMVRTRKPRARRAAEPEQIGSAMQEVVQNAVEAANGNADKPRKPLPDPHGMHTIGLADEKDGPKMRLARRHRCQWMEMQFDENPGEEVRAALTAPSLRSLDCGLLGL